MEIQREGPLDKCLHGGKGLRMTFKFPSHRHIPASGSTPDRGPLDAVKILTPPRVSADTWHLTPAYPYGLHLYSHGFFWEAHEVWEAVWLATAPNSQERHLLAGLIQLANACLKLEMAQPKAALRLLRDAQDHLGECRRPVLLGLAPRVLVQDIRAFADQLAAAETGKLRSVLARRPKPVLAGAE